MSTICPLGFHLRPIEHISWGITRRVSHPLPSLTQLYYDYEDDDGAIDREGGRIGWRLGMNHGMAGAGQMVQQTYRRHFIAGFRLQTFSSRNSSDASFPGYTGVIDGKFTSGRISGEYTFTSIDAWR